MSTRVFICKIFLAFSIYLSPSAVCTAQDNVTTIQAKPDAKSEKTDRLYNRLLKEERQASNPKKITERIAAGVAALTIGLYGYYNDNRGILTKVVYSATQTAGVVMVSSAILDANQPSLLLYTDKYLQKNGQIDYQLFKIGIVSITKQRKIGEQKQLAYTCGILSGIYLYNGYREQKNIAALSNAFYFLSFNFLLISAASFYKVYSSAKVSDDKEKDLSFYLNPYPTIAYQF